MLGDTREMQELRLLIEIMMDPVRFAEYRESLRRKGEAFAAAKRAKWERWLLNLTEIQRKQLVALMGLGAKPCKLFQDRSTEHVAVMLTRPNVYDPGKGKIRRKLYMVYPDGSRAETFDQSISVKGEF